MYRSSVICSLEREETRDMEIRDCLCALGLRKRLRAWGRTFVVRVGTETGQEEDGKSADEREAEDDEELEIIERGQTT